jgi:hypothetical protein
MADEPPTPPPAPAPEAPAPARRPNRLTPTEEKIATAAGVRWPVAPDTVDPMNLPYHEAGHTLVGLALGRPLNYVSIAPGDQTSDFEALTGTDRPTVERWIKTALGGPLAEQRRFGVSWGCKADIAGILYEIEKNLAGVDGIAFVAEIAGEVTRLLELHGEALDVLAQALIEKPCLTGDEVCKLVTINGPVSQSMVAISRR